MDFEEAIREYNQQSERTKDPTTCCSLDLIPIDGFATCLSCGIGYETPHFIVQHSGFSVKRYVCYKRISYFKHILRLVACRKTCHSPKYGQALVLLKGQQFDTLHGLRKLMKQNGMAKLYPYIFLLYRDIKKVEAVQLTSKHMTQLLSLFRWFEATLRRAGKTKHFFSYYLLMNRFLKKLHHPHWERVTVPVSNKGKRKEVDNILLTLDIHNDNEKYSYQIKGP